MVARDRIFHDNQTTSLAPYPPAMPCLFHIKGNGLMDMQPATARRLVPRGCQGREAHSVSSLLITTNPTSMWRS